MRSYTEDMIKDITKHLNVSQTDTSLDLNNLFQNTVLDVVSTFVIGKAPGASSRGDKPDPTVVALSQAVKFATMFGALRQQSRVLTAPFECIAHFIPPNLIRLVRVLGPLIEERLSAEKPSADLSKCSSWSDCQI